jgi:hypothetical protein
MVAEQNVATVQVDAALLINLLITLVPSWPPDRITSTLYCSVDCILRIFNWTFDCDTFTKPQLEVSFMPLLTNKIVNSVCNLSSLQLQISMLQSFGVPSSQKTKL